MAIQTEALLSAHAKAMRGSFLERSGTTLKKNNSVWDTPASGSWLFLCLISLFPALACMLHETAAFCRAAGAVAWATVHPAVPGPAHWLEPTAMDRQGR